MVAIDSPPPKVTPRPIFLSIPAYTKIVRLYDPNSFGTRALSFRTYGPISRFDHQRALYPDRINDKERGIIYSATTLSSCLVEIFGDLKVIEVGSWEVAAITTTRTLNLLDLRGSGAMRAGTVSAISKESNRRFSQEWSRYFYDTTFLYG
ncbi:MAG: RES domain-containing protein, partial [Candidatus Obscuribacterales bacterium]|nr:RES domain-containing protein [Candidatus Obscuribacterales bacterium]